MTIVLFIGFLLSWVPRDPIPYAAAVQQFRQPGRHIINFDHAGDVEEGRGSDYNAGW
jgi:hypothetical protein